MKKLSIFIILLLVVSIGGSTVVNAATESERIATLRARLDDRNETIATLRSRIDDRNDTIATLRERVNDRNAALEQRNATIADLRAQLNGDEKDEIEPQTYTVKSGDTLYKIAKELDFDLNKLIKLNDLESPYVLDIGQTLVLSEEVQPQIYTVKQGDTIMSIAKVLDVDWVEIIEHNDIKSPWWVEIGQKLEIPNK